MTLPKIVSPKGQVIGNLAMGGAAAAVLVWGIEVQFADVPAAVATSIGTLFGGLFQRFNLFG